MIKWNNLSRLEQLDTLYEDSFQKPQLIFKHSTRCSISSMALNRFERQWDQNPDQITPVFLDLIEHRNISNTVSEKFDIKHESPQILLISKGRCIYNTSHNDITLEHLKEHLVKV